MILSDKKILEEIKKGSIIIHPFDKEKLGCNSYDVHLSKFLATYDDKVLDAKKHNTITHFEIPEEGYVLEPGILYLGSLSEYIEIHKHALLLEGKSSTGRLGIDIHATAGVVDVGFRGHLTLEISAQLPVRVYADMPIGQMLYYEVTGDIETMYYDKKSAKYSDQGAKPMESMMWKNDF